MKKTMFQFIVALFFGLILLHPFTLYSQDVRGIINEIYNKHKYQRELPGEKTPSGASPQSENPSKLSEKNGISVPQDTSKNKDRGKRGNILVKRDPQFIHGTIKDVSSKWKKVELKKTYKSMVVVASPIIKNATKKTVVVRISDVTNNSFNIKIQCPSNNKYNSKFDVTFIVTEEGVFENKQSDVKFEAGKVNCSFNSGKDNWKPEQISIQSNFLSPVVLGQVMTSDDPKWSNFWSGSVENYTDPAKDNSSGVGKHIGEDDRNIRNSLQTTEEIGYMIFEAGYFIYNNKIFEAGSKSIDSIDNDTKGTKCDLQYINQISNLVVSVSGMSNNDGSIPVIRNLDKARISIVEDQMIDNERVHEKEQVNYLAIGNYKDTPKDFSSFETAMKIIFNAGYLVFFVIFYLFLFEKLSLFSVIGAETAKSKEDDYFLDGNFKSIPLETKIEKLLYNNNFIEAIHEMLKELISDIQLKLDTTITNSLTTREVIRNARIPQSAKTQVQIIASEVEICFFGRKECKRKDYDKCLAAYEQFKIICYSKK